MKRILVSLGCILAVAVTAAADEPGMGEKEAYFFSRHLRVTNETSETLTLHVQFRVYEKGEWLWTPGNPDSGKTFERSLEAGKELVLEDMGTPFAASRVRLWAVGASVKLEAHRHKDLWLVPEVDTDEHRYKAVAMETFTHVLSTKPSRGERVEGEEKTAGDSDPMPIRDSEPTRGTDGGPVGDLGGGGGLGGGDTGGGLGGGDGGLGGGDGAPADPMGGDGKKLGKDLAIDKLFVDKTGDFRATIQNLSDQPYLIGRFWVLRQEDKGGFKTLKKSLVPPIFPKGKITIKGKVAITADARFVLELTPADGNPENDKAGPVGVGEQGTPGTSPLDPGKDGKDPGKTEPEIADAKKAQPDLAITELKIDGKAVVGKIVNLGPGAYKGGRTFELFSAFQKTGGAVKPLAKGAFVLVRLNLDTLDKKQTLVLKLSAGDGKPDNDTRNLVHNPKTATSTGAADLAIASMTKSGNKVTVVVRNLGSAKSAAGRTLTVTARKLGGQRVTLRTASIGPVLPGGGVSFTIDLPAGARDIQAALNTTAGENPGNDRRTMP